MGFFVGIVIGLAVIGFGIWASFSFDDGSDTTGVVAVILCIVCLVAFAIVPWSFHTIDSGEVAVVKHFGEAKEVKQPGLNYDFWGTNKYVFLDCKVQTLDIQTLAYSSDAQTMDILANVQFQILPDKALDIVKTYGSLDALTTRIQATITERPKVVTSQYKAMDIIANRADVTAAIETEVRAAIADAGYPVNITNIAVTNFDFSDAFETAVEEKMIAEQKQLKAAYENQTKIAQAEADAKAKVVAAEAEAKANELLEKSLTDKILQEMYIDKWNGVMPQVVSGDENGIMISMPGTK